MHTGLTGSKKRIQKQLENFTPLASYSVQLVDGDLMHWIAKLIPPDDSIYAGGVYQVDIKFRNDYPFSPPRCTFITPFYHPGVSGNWKICIKSNYSWSPAQKVQYVLMEIYLLFTQIFWQECQNYNFGAANLLKQDFKKFQQYVRQHVKKYAIKKQQQ